MTESHRPQHYHPPLEESVRFAPPPTRRDFLGLAAIWSSIIAFGGALLGSLRLPMPSVFPESNPTVKIGMPDTYAQGTQTYLEHLRVWIFHDDQGFYAISAVCTHLGCIVARDSANGKFVCPCHGSVYKANGMVIAGPAPSALHWLALSLAPDGQLVVDQRRTVPLGTKFTV